MVGAPSHNLAEKIAVMREEIIPEGIPARVITSEPHGSPIRKK